MLQKFALNKTKVVFLRTRRRQNVTFMKEIRFTSWFLELISIKIWRNVRTSNHDSTFVRFCIQNGRRCEIISSCWRVVKPLYQQLFSKNIFPGSRRGIVALAQSSYPIKLTEDRGEEILVCGICLLDEWLSFIGICFLSVIWILDFSYFIWFWSINTIVQLFLSRNKR